MTPVRDFAFMSTPTPTRTRAPSITRARDRVGRCGRYRRGVVRAAALRRCDEERRGRGRDRKGDVDLDTTTTSCEPPYRRRVVVTAAPAAALAMSLSLALSMNEPAWAGGNDAVLAALAKRQTAETMTTGGVENRLQRDIDEAVQARTLALTGNYDGARRILREGSLSKLRLDLQTTAKFIRDNANEAVPTRDVTLALDAFDDALRAEAIKVDNASIEDVRRTADELIEVLKGIVGRIERASALPTSSSGY